MAKSIKLGSDTYLDWSGIATDSTGYTLDEKLSSLYVRWVGTGSGNTHLTVKRDSSLPASTEVQFFLFASGSGGTTLCGIGYVRESAGLAYFTSLGSKAITCTYDGNGGALLTVGTYCTGLILANRKFEVSVSA